MWGLGFSISFATPDFLISESIIVFHILLLIKSLTLWFFVILMVTENKTL